MSICLETPKRRQEDPKKNSPNKKSLDAELCGLGHIRRHLQPPGGHSNGIFDALKLPLEVLTPRKKVKDYLKSQIFAECGPSPPRPVTPAKETTHYHLFGHSPPQMTPRSRNRLKSTVFDPDPPNKARKEFVKRNPITGESCNSSRENNKKLEREIRNPITFEGVLERHIPSRCKQPPGGKCTFVLEYIE